MEHRFVTMADFLTEDQLEKAVFLHPDTKAIREQVIEPNMAAINELLGQENDAAYLAYAVTHAINQRSR